MTVHLETKSIAPRVRVVHGELAGLTGVIVRLTGDARKCLLKIDGWDDGAYLSISADALALELKMNATPDRSALRVVVVEDNYDANAAITKLLEKSGFQVAGRAYDGIAGLNVIKSTKPDVAILDIAMPALDGYALARRVKSEVDSPPRLVALTGYGKEEDKSEAVSAGFDAYFRKPADWQALESLLANYAGTAA